MSLAGAAVLAFTGAARAQTPASYGRALESWTGLPVTPGYERTATDRILAQARGWTRDELGNLVKRAGSGSPRRVIACGLDETGYAVSEITADGYLRVHPAGTARHVALWDDFHEGQRAFVLATGGRATHGVPAVFAVHSTHLLRGRSANEAPHGVDSLWIDVGARSRAEVEAMGIRMLDPVFREWPRWSYGEYVAGPAAGDRAGCAAVVAGGQAGAPAHGENIYVVSVQSQFGWAGLTSVLARSGAVDSLVLLTSQRVRLPAIAAVRVGATVQLSPSVRSAGTLVESVSETELAAYVKRVAAAADVTSPLAFVDVGEPWAAPPAASMRDSLSSVATLLAQLTNTYAVSGFETPVRTIVMDHLPPWARTRARTDSAGNVILAVGPQRDTVVFVAHMDEIGFVVSQIAHDGTVTLRSRGGGFPSLWEGQTAIAHLPSEVAAPANTSCVTGERTMVRGIFVPRDSATTKEARELHAWFGTDSAGLAGEGVHIGTPVTSYKCATRLGPTRFSARAIDDRTGVTALLLAVESIDPAKLGHTVIFVWSTREEVGLEGARAAAAEFGPSVRRVHAIDTFVSSDSPIENHAFADVPLGSGPVARALDNSSSTPPDEVAREVAIARAAGITLPVATTNGGNDGSEFTRLGAINGPLGWPSRYSHSPVELLDLRDVHALARTIAALANAGRATRDAGRGRP